MLAVAASSRDYRAKERAFIGLARAQSPQGAEAEASSKNSTQCRALTEAIHKRRELERFVRTRFEQPGI